jgi:hypothetical protein
MLNELVVNMQGKFVSMCTHLKSSLGLLALRLARDCSAAAASLLAHDAHKAHVQRAATSVALQQKNCVVLAHCVAAVRAPQQAPIAQRALADLAGSQGRNAVA